MALVFFFYSIVFSRTCAGKKHRNPPVFPQENRETGPQAGAEQGLHAATALPGRAASAAWGAGSP